MYRDFFGLKRNPFELSPNPHFLLPTDKIKETLFSVHYAIAERKGFVVLTGEVGTGKTLMVRCMLDLLRRQHIQFANVFNPRLAPIDFLRFVVNDLGITVVENTKANLLLGLYRFLLTQLEKKLTTVLVVDEAQELSLSVLEEIRLLTNLETSQQKLLQIVLVGQPELDAKLDCYELRQLKQRIAIRCRLEPLREDEVRTYIDHRLQVAGTNGHVRVLFPDETIAAVYQHSLGIPRIINSLCDQALLAAFARQQKVIRVAEIDEIAKYYRLQSTATFTKPENGHSNGDSRKQATTKSLLDMIEKMERVAAELARN